MKPAETRRRAELSEERIGEENSSFKAGSLFVAAFVFPVNFPMQIGKKALLPDRAAKRSYVRRPIAPHSSNGWWRVWGCFSPLFLPPPSVPSAARPLLVGAV